MSVRERPVPVAKGSSVGSSPMMLLEESPSADMPIPKATKSPTPCVLVEEKSPLASVDAVLEASLDESVVRCKVGDVVFRKEALGRVPFCDDEEEAAALHTSTIKTTSERNRRPIRTSAIASEVRTKRKWTKNRTKEQFGSETTRTR